MSPHQQSVSHAAIDVSHQKVKILSRITWWLHRTIMTDSYYTFTWTKSTGLIKNRSVFYFPLVILNSGSIQGTSHNFTAATFGLSCRSPHIAICLRTLSHCQIQGFIYSEFICRIYMLVTFHSKSPFYSFSNVKNMQFNCSTFKIKIENDLSGRLRNCNFKTR